MQHINDRAIAPGTFIPEPDDDRIICRCEDDHRDSQIS